MKKHSIYTLITIALGIGLLTGFYYTFQRFFVYNSFSLNLRDGFVYLFQVVGIVGLVIFASSKFKKSALIRIYMCREILSLPLTVWYYRDFFQRGGFRTGNSSSIVYFGIFLTVIALAASVAGLIMLTKERTVKLQYLSIGEKKIAEFRPVSAGTRFINYLVDTVMILYIFSNIYYVLKYMVLNDQTRYYEDNNTTGLFQLFSVMIYLLYYLILEGLFNTTAGKCATNTMVVNSSGLPANFGQRIGRSFCRLIPFNPLSFFGRNARGWHDTITDTYVVDTVLKEEVLETESDDGDLIRL